jgi:hypothetical protein
LRHAGKIEVWQHLGVYQLEHLFGIAGLNILILLDDGQNILGGILHQHIRWNFGRHGRTANQHGSRQQHGPNFPHHL